MGMQVGELIADDQDVFGGDVNLASRLTTLAGPGEIVMSDETRRLVRASFEMQPLGALALKGFAQAVEAALQVQTSERAVYLRALMAELERLGIAAAMLVLGPAWGLLLAATHFVLYVFVLAPSINGLGHWWGRKNFGNNSATNLRVLAWLTGGESLHNNHHAYPSSPKFSMGRFEFDPSWVVIRVLMLLRLARLVGDKVKLAA